MYWGIEGRAGRHGSVSLAKSTSTRRWLRLSQLLFTTPVLFLHSPLTHVLPYCENENSYVILTLYPRGGTDAGRQRALRVRCPDREGGGRPGAEAGRATRERRPGTCGHAPSLYQSLGGGFVVGATPRKRAQTKRARVSAHGDVSCGCACTNFPPHSPPARSTVGALGCSACSLC